jgi:uncharacterized integral membrane protein (TIGR00698 family)
MRALYLYVIEDTVRRRVGGVRFTVGVSTSRFGTRSVIRSYYDTSFFAAFYEDGFKLLLQLSVIGLGFGINLHQIIETGRSGFIYTAVSITLTVLLGLLIGQLLRVRGRLSYLISIGTPICGASAIAAVAPVIDAKDEEMMMSLSTVFILNSVALLLFPLLGLGLQLTQEQFGLWAALAIHDTSSVVGACAKYGDASLMVGMTVKLSRALWIVPVALMTAFFIRGMNQQKALESNGEQSGSAKPRMPWFILFFVCASIVATYLPKGAGLYELLTFLAKIGLTVTMYLIGSSITLKTIRAVGFSTLLQGTILWIIIAVGALLLIDGGLITL